MADIYQAEITKMLHRYDIFTRHERALPIVKDGRVICWNTPERFTPDLTGGLVHQIHIEVKTGKNELFCFHTWNEGQRKYAKEWRLKRGCEYWIAVVVETKHSNNNVNREAFMVPYPVMMKTEEIFSGIQKSIPYKAVKNMNREVQKRALSMERLWVDFRLNWVPGYGWALPVRNHFAKMYLNQESYLYKGKSIMEKL